MSANIKSFSKGEIIFREGSAGTYAYFLTKGAVEISVEREGKKVILEEVPAGRCFGEMGPILGLKRSASAQATEYTEAYLIDAPLLEKLLQESNPLLRTIAYALISRVRRLTESSAKGRLSHSPLVAAAQTLDLMAQIERLQHKAHPSGETPVALNYRSCARTVGGAIGLSDHVVDALLKKMAALSIFQIDGVGEYKVIRITDPNLKEKTAKIVAAAGDLLSEHLQAENLLVTLDELAAELDAPAQQLAELLVSNPHLMHQILLRKHDVMALFRGDEDGAGTEVPPAE